MYMVYEDIAGVKWRIKTVATEGGAKRSVTALERKRAARQPAGQFPQKKASFYGWMSAEDWVNRKVPMKKVRNLMSGEEFEIAADTPAHCDPSSETYWSM